MTEVFTVTTNETVTLQNSFGTVKGPDTREMVTRIWIHDNNPKRGSFSWYSEEGDYWAEGGLWFDDDGFLTDYDGVFSLPPTVAWWLDCDGRLTEDDVAFWREEGVLK